jgi:hypothetical protein
MVHHSKLNNHREIPITPKAKILRIRTFNTPATSNTSSLVKISSSLQEDTPGSKGSPKLLTPGTTLLTPGNNNDNKFNLLLPLWGTVQIQGRQQQHFKETLSIRKPFFLPTLPKQSSHQPLKTIKTPALLLDDLRTQAQSPPLQASSQAITLTPSRTETVTDSNL